MLFMMPHASWHVAADMIFRFGFFAMLLPPCRHYATPQRMHTLRHAAITLPLLLMLLSLPTLLPLRLRCHVLPPPCLILRLLIVADAVSLCDAAITLLLAMPYY